ncbi:GNAT family N-acetyltransferase [Paenibacillus turpanensis]|uniref:GNAT family N-acetyltransferase n=1 Tax=Paenibacillus turpanensis TaxID=2689078 RepID=UPI00140CF0C4|nr:GNAT family N-acetyltransferase [Paenibacillus turpanensis]
MIRSYANSEDTQYVVESHCRIYCADYGYDDSFVEFIVQAVEDFEKHRDATKENIWLVETGGSRKGSIAIVKYTEEAAQLRWFLLEPEVRNQGYGKQLLQAALQFCRENQYKCVFLWTNDSLTAARALYESFGFQVVKRKTRSLPDQTLNEEKWELILD